MKYIPAFVILTFLAVFFVRAQDQDAGMAAGKAARTGYVALKLEDLPRDEKGFLKPEIWDIIAAEAKANPNSNEARTLQERGVSQAYYATYANWKAPEPLPVGAGRLRNLSEPPKEPRFPLTDKVWSEHPGDASVCLWEDDKLAAMSLGVDDNCAGDLPYWKELSRKYGGLNITWNLISGNIDGVISKGRVSSAGTWKIWQQMLDESYHLVSHSVTHHHDPVPADGWPGPEWEAAESIHQIDSHLPGHKTRVYVYAGAGVRVFGQPRNLIASAWRPAIIKYYAAARGGGRNAINQANMIDYFDIHATTGSVPFLLSNTDPKMADQNLNNLFAADPKNPHHNYYRGWANVFIHFINNGKDFDTNPFNVAYGKVLEFYNQHRNELWTGFIDDVVLYGQERDTATVKTDEATNEKIAFTLVSKMEPTIFDYPLTIKVRLPDAWKTVAASQKTATLPAQFVLHEGRPYALVKVAPDRGQVILKSVINK